MRVITGSARGRRLQTLQGDDVRPTTDRVKESLFNIIQFEVEGRRVLDLFAGSGQLGIEALSRGAKQAVFVDASREATAVIRDNLTGTGLSGRAKVRHMDAFAALESPGQTYDIALLDPPYGQGLVQKALPLVAACMAPGGVILCETPAGEALPEQAGGFQLSRCYRYGKIQVATYRRKEGEAQ